MSLSEIIKFLFLCSFSSNWQLFNYYVLFYQPIVTHMKLNKVNKNTLYFLKEIIKFMSLQTSTTYKNFFRKKPKKTWPQLLLPHFNSNGSFKELLRSYKKLFFCECSWRILFQQATLCIIPARWNLINLYCYYLPYNLTKNKIYYHYTSNLATTKNDPREIISKCHQFYSC